MCQVIELLEAPQTTVSMRHFLRSSSDRSDRWTQSSLGSITEISTQTSESELSEPSESLEMASVPRAVIVQGISAPWLGGWWFHCRFITVYLNNRSYEHIWINNYCKVDDLMKTFMVLIFPQWLGWLTSADFSAGLKAPSRWTFFFAVHLVGAPPLPRTTNLSIWLFGYLNPRNHTAAMVSGCFWHLELWFHDPSSRDYR